MAIFVDNAMGWAQYRLRGGWKNILLTSCGYAVLVVVAIFIMAQTTVPARRPELFANWTRGLLLLQTGALVIFGGTRISSAIRADISNKLMESHRLMPLSPVGAVTGYIAGSTVQALSLAFVNLLIGVATAPAAGFPVDVWLMANLVLFAFSTFVWSLAALGGLGGPNIIVMGVVLFIGTTTSEGELSALIPGLTLLISPVIGNSIFSFRATLADLGLPYLLAITAQAAFGGMILTAACRKYRYIDEPAFNTMLGLLMLGVWAAVSLAAFQFWEEIAPWISRRSDMTDRERFISSIVASMVLALVPVTASARADSSWMQRRRFGDQTLPRRPISPLLVLLIASGICSILFFVSPAVLPMTIRRGVLQQPELTSLQRHALASLVILLSLMPISYLARWTYLAVPRAVIILSVWMFCTWLAPILADLVFHQAQTPDLDFQLGTVSTVSPIGALQVLWKHTSRPAWIGIGTQLALTVLAASVFYFAAAKMKPRMSTHT